jgi:large subunit ribosomal protein L3
MKFILGKKEVMTQIFREDGVVVPVTKIVAGPCVVTQIKTEAKDNARSVQVGFDAMKEKNMAKPKQGHLKGLPAAHFLHDFKVEGNDSFERGDVLDLTSFVEGDRVQVTGISKGHGFQGVVKRHHFSGGPASHGHKDNLRMPGTSGAGGVQRVFKGLRMGGRMGGAQITVKNLEVVKIDAAANVVYIRGAVPGPRGSYLMIYCPGEMKAVKKQASPEAVAVVAPTPAPEAAPAPVETPVAQA